jgi:hypothetical protein
LATLGAEVVRKGSSRLNRIIQAIFGPTMDAFEAAEQAGKAEELHSPLVDLVKAPNQGTNEGSSISATFLRVIVNL